MAKYRKRPAIIEAVKWSDNTTHPGVKVAEDGRCYVTTIQGQRAYLTTGDWIIAEKTPGYFYPCDPVVFVETYDLVEAL